MPDLTEFREVRTIKLDLSHQNIHDLSFQKSQEFKRTFPNSPCDAYYLGFRDALRYVLEHTLDTDNTSN